MYLIQYSYEGQQSEKAFHFVETDHPEKAIYAATIYITQLLYLRFGKHIEFTIEDFEELP